MEFSDFSLNLGTSQGRIQPSNWTPTDGDWAFCLGSDIEEQFASLEVGDYVEIVQMIDLTSVNFIRASLHLRNPEGMPSNRTWEASIWTLGLPGVKRASAIARPGKTRDLSDLAANVSGLSGNYQVSFRLTLEAI